MTISDRFVLFLREKKISQKKFCAATGFAEKNLSNFINGTVKSPRINIITALVKHFPELNLNWLLLGKGQMLHNTNAPTLPHQKSTPADEDQIVDQMEHDDLIKELIANKNQLINSQEKRIELLEAEIQRLKTPPLSSL